MLSCSRKLPHLVPAAALIMYSEGVSKFGLGKLEEGSAMLNSHLTS